MQTNKGKNGDSIKVNNIDVIDLVFALDFLKNIQSDVIRAIYGLPDTCARVVLSRNDDSDETIYETQYPTGENHHEYFRGKKLLAFHNADGPFGLLNPESEFEVVEGRSYNLEKDLENLGYAIKGLENLDIQGLEIMLEKARKVSELGYRVLESRTKAVETEDNDAKTKDKDGEKDSDDPFVLTRDDIALPYSLYNKFTVSAVESAIKGDFDQARKSLDIADAQLTNIPSLSPDDETLETYKGHTEKLRTAFGKLEEKLE